MSIQAYAQTGNIIWDLWGGDIEIGDPVMFLPEDGPQVLQKGIIKGITPRSGGNVAFEVLEDDDPHSAAPPETHKLPFTRIRQEDPEDLFSHQDWRSDVSNDDANQGFEQWIEDQFEASGHAPSQDQTRAESKRPCTRRALRLPT